MMKNDFSSAPRPIKDKEIIDVRIVDYAFAGKGIAKIPSDKGDYIVFVPNTFPGQLVRVRILKKKKRYSEATLLEIIERSPAEHVRSFCEISGAPYIYVDLQEQQHYKKKSALELYEKLGQIKDIHSRLDCFITSPLDFFYRNKMEYSFSCIGHNRETGEDIDGDFALGFKRRGTWWKVENLDYPSGLFDQEWESKLPEIRRYLHATNLPAWHPPQKIGFFRHLVVRKSFYTNQLLVNLVSSSQGIELFDGQQFGFFLQELFGDRIAGLQHTINDDVSDRSKLENGSSATIFGSSTIEEKIIDLSFNISMESFFQPNPKCAELFYQKAIDYALEEPLSNKHVFLDLFCGTGTIGQLLARQNQSIEVIGVDIIEQAILDAQENARKNKLDKEIRFFASDVGKFLRNYPEFNQQIACIILDPPRAGIAPKTLQKIIDLQADTIVYISCNPSTQARDAAILYQAGYRIDKLSLIDQFPHTGHIEALAKFVKEKIKD